MTRRILSLMLFLAAPISVFAQNDVGLWLNETQFKATSFNDIQSGSIQLKFHQKLGYGLSFNHFSGPNMSSEFAWHQLKSTARVHINAPGVSQATDVGDFKVNQLSALLKWHFMPRSFIVPYIGGGVAYFTGGGLHTANDPALGTAGETVDFENKFGFVIDGGVNFAVMPRMSIGLDIRHAPYKAHEKGTDSSDDIKLDPTTIALGLRIRM